MRKLVVIVCLLFCLKSQAQTDTTKIYNLSLSARLIEYLAPFVATPDNDENLDLFLKWRKVYRTVNPSSNASVVTDTISVNTLAYLYNVVLQNQEGFSFSPSFKTAIQSARNANSNLDRKCASIEALYSNQVTSIRQRGRKLLTGQ